MKQTLNKLERRARYTMAILAAALVLLLLCFKAGLITKAPVYEADKWYAIDDRGSYVVTSEHATEIGCRAGNMLTGAKCRSGQALIVEASAKSRTH